MIADTYLPSYLPKMSSDLVTKLTAQAKDGCWWKQSVSSMTDMVIQLLARKQLNTKEIAAFVDCPQACVNLIAQHYKATIARIHTQYEHTLRRRINIDT